MSEHPGDEASFITGEELVIDGGMTRVCARCAHALPPGTQTRRHCLL